MKARALSAGAVLAVGLALAATARAQETKEAPLQAGSEGVPVPKRSKTVPPQYPPEAQAAGIRGIVILELVVDAQGKVESVSVIRSLPGLDEAAVEAARQWEYDVTKVGGKPVSVRLTVPITFAMRLPEMTRQDGIPELRQGAAPPFPEGERGSAEVAAELTVDADGQVTEIRVTQGEAPWADMVLRALRTWRFAAPADNASISFRVQADFIPARGRDAQRVALRLDGLRHSDAFASASSTSAPSTSVPPATAPAAPTIPPPTAPASAPATSPPAPVATLPAPIPAAPPPTAPPATAPAAPAAPAPAPAAPGPAPAKPTPPPPATASVASPAPGAAPPPGKVAPPPVEVVSAPPPPEPVETGSSAVRDVVLAESGVPDLARGRRPVVPPFARMTGTGGAVEVDFSVGASGITAIQAVKGPDLLKPAAEQTVSSWVFRRTKVERLYLVAVFQYEGDKVTASVKPQPPPSATP